MKLKSIVIALLVTVAFSGYGYGAEYSDAAAAYRAGEYTKAFRVYKELAEQGDLRAQLNLAWMYSQGEGTPADSRLAVQWYRTAAQRGNATAQFNLAAALEQGTGTPVSRQEALYWYRQAARNGDSQAQSESIRLAQQLDAEAAAQARKQQAAVTAVPSAPQQVQQHAAPSQRAAAVAPAPTAVQAAAPAPPRSGVPAAVDKVSEQRVHPQFRAMLAAARRGDPAAQTSVGWVYSSGKYGVTQDKAQAVTWYRMAAEKEHLPAQKALAYLLSQPDSGVMDLKQSRYWHERAKANRHAVSRKGQKR